MRVFESVLRDTSRKRRPILSDLLELCGCVLRMPRWWGEWSSNQNLPTEVGEVSVIARKYATRCEHCTSLMMREITAVCEKVPRQHLLTLKTEEFR